jgi:DNA polymerase III alpha subunit
MKFLSLEDLSGTFEVTLFPDCYRKYAHVTGGYGPFLVEGKVDAEFGVPSVTAARLENLRFSLGEDPSGVMCFAAGPDCGG